MKEFLLFLVILNPFAQILYLSELMNSLTSADFIRVHLRASLLSLGVFVLFALVGENVIMKHLFQVRLASLQIFGGIIMLFLSYRYIIVGPGSNILFRGNISDMAPQISLPYMVGPGTIWVSILIGRKYSVAYALAIITLVLMTNFLVLITYQFLQLRLNQKKEGVLRTYFAILMRTNALFIGAIAVEMLITGLENVLRDYGLL